MSTLQDVAKLAGVSTATVSRTFTNPGKLNTTTRRHILDVAAKLDYRPRPRATKTEVVQSWTEPNGSIGFLFFAAEHDGSQINEFYAPVMMGAQAEAARAGLHLIIRTASRFNVPAELPNILSDDATAGTLLVGAALPKVLEAYTFRHQSSVIVDNRDPTGKHDCILTDGFGGMVAATQYLIGLGHSRIAFVWDEPTAPSFNDRRHGYLCALWDAGIIPRNEWIVSMPRDAEAEPYLNGLLTHSDRPTAIVAANDRNAFAVLAACRALGISVPTELSIVGFDNTGSSVYCYPALTTVSVDKEQVGRLAVRQLLSRIDEKKAGQIPLAASDIVVPVELIVRDSCAQLIDPAANS